MKVGKEKVRVACYLRVSTDEQAENGHGLAFQEEKLKSFIELHEFIFDKDRHFFVDEGYSGTLHADKRPALQRMFDAAERKEFDVVLVYRLDRFGRRILLILDGVRHLDECGVAFRSVTEPFDTSNAFGRYLLASLGALAELERETIKERTQGGRRIAAGGNRWIWGTPPYGYRIDSETKKLSVVKSEAKWVKKFMEWIANDGMTLTGVQRKANELRVPCYNKRKRKKKELEGYWHKKTIGKMVSNAIYTGHTYFFRYKGDFRGLSSLTDENLQNSKDEWIDFKTDAIVDENLFQRCQEQLQRNREMAARNLKNDYLYNKLVHCGECGKKMYAGRKRGYRYYHSAHNAKWRKAIVEDKRCLSCGQVSELAMEPVWEELEKILRNPSYMIPKLHSYIKKPKSSRALEEKLSEQKKLALRLSAQSKKIDNVYLNGDSIGSHEDYLKMKARVKRELQGVKEQISLLESKKEAIQGMQEKDIDNMVSLFERLNACLNVVTYEQKATIVHLLVKRIELDHKNKQVTVHLNVLQPEAEKGILSPLSAENIRQMLYNQRSRVGASTDGMKNGVLGNQRLHPVTLWYADAHRFRSRWERVARTFGGDEFLRS